MLKDCIVVMLPTDKGSNLQLIGKRLVWFDNPQYSNSGYTSQHLYICSTDEIKEGDYLYSPELNTIVGPTKDRHLYIKGESKVIATTDTSLHYNVDDRLLESFNQKRALPSINIPAIPQSFIELYIKRYNKGNPITNVKVECELEGNIEDLEHGIIIYKPKLNGNEIVIHTQQETFTREEFKKGIIQAVAWLKNPMSTKEFEEWFNSKY